MLGKSNLVGRELVCRQLPNTAMLLKTHNNTLPLPFTEPTLLPCHSTLAWAVCLALLLLPQTQMLLAGAASLHFLGGLEASTNVLCQTSGFPVGSSVTLHCSSPADRQDALTSSPEVHFCRKPEFPSLTHLIPAALPAIILSTAACNTKKQSQWNWSFAIRSQWLIFAEFVCICSGSHFLC